MKSMKKMILFALLLVAAVAMLPAGAKAAKRTKTLDLSGITTGVVTNSTEGWQWHANNKILTLDNVDIEVEEGDGIILPKGGLTIVVKGTNTITCNNDAAIRIPGSMDEPYVGSYAIEGDESAVLKLASDYNGICFSGDLKVKDINLEIKARYPLYARQLTFENCSAKISGTDILDDEEDGYLVKAYVDEDYGITGEAFINLNNCYVKSGGAVLKQYKELSYIGIANNRTANYVEIARGKPTSIGKASIKKFYKQYNSLELYWSVPNGSNGTFTIYRSTKKSSGFKKVGTSKKATYLDKGLKFNKTYYYYIKSDNGAGKTSKSSVKSAKTRLNGVNASFKRESKKDLISWFKTPGASGYMIYRASSYKGKYSLVKTITSGKDGAYRIKRPKASKYYYYKICAYRKSGSKKIKGPKWEIGESDYDYDGDE